MKSVIIAHAAAIVFTLVGLYAIHAMDQAPTIIVSAGAEDDCPYHYGGLKLRNVVGLEIEGQHRVECRY